MEKNEIVGVAKRIPFEKILPETYLTATLKGEGIDLVLEKSLIPYDTKIIKSKISHKCLLDSCQKEIFPRDDHIIIGHTGDFDRFHIPCAAKRLDQLKKLIYEEPFLELIVVELGYMKALQNIMNKIVHEEKIKSKTEENGGN